MWASSTHKLITICTTIVALAIVILLVVLCVRITGESTRVRIEKVRVCAHVPDPISCIKEN